MKKTWITLLAVLSLGLLQAQTDGFKKEDRFVSGMAGFQSNNKENTYFLYPRIGYFISDPIAAGLGLSLTVRDREANDLSTDFGLELFTRYYFATNKTFSLFSEFSIGNTFAKDMGFFNAGIQIGMHYFLSKNFALEASIGALSYRLQYGEYIDNSYSFRLFGNLSSPAIGVIYRF